MRWEFEGLINIPTTMLIGIVLVVFAFNLALPISQLANTVTRSTLGIALASVMLSFLMMITRRKAIPQVIGFLSMENGLFFAATSATYGMPMVVELGIALDVLVGMLILGVFFFQIREQFDSLDLKHLEKLKENEERAMTARTGAVIEILAVLGAAARSAPRCSRSSAIARAGLDCQRGGRASRTLIAAAALTCARDRRRSAARRSTSSSSSIRSTCSWSR